MQESFDIGGYTGTRKDAFGLLTGIVHRGEYQFPCNCGGWIHLYDDGEVIRHWYPNGTVAECKYIEGGRLSYG